VFAYHMVKGSDFHVWIKLLTFPVFILAVITGGRITIRTSNPYILLLWEAILLLLAGLLACISGSSMMYPVAMLVVFAMGLQNAFGKLFSKATYGPTTMMTGNVTQASLDLGMLIRSKLKDAETIHNMKHHVVTIGGFLSGCLLGALFAQRLGLSVLLLPGLAMVVCYFSTHTKRE